MVAPCLASALERSRTISWTPPPFRDNEPVSMATFTYESSEGFVAPRRRARVLRARHARWWLRYEPVLRSSSSLIRRTGCRSVSFRFVQRLLARTIAVHGDAGRRRHQVASPQVRREGARRRATSCLRSAYALASRSVCQWKKRRESSL